MTHPKSSFVIVLEDRLHHQLRKLELVCRALMIHLKSFLVVVKQVHLKADSREVSQVAHHVARGVPGIMRCEIGRSMSLALSSLITLTSVFVKLCGMRGCSVILRRFEVPSIAGFTNGGNIMVVLEVPCQRRFWLSFG